MPETSNTFATWAKELDKFAVVVDDPTIVDTNFSENKLFAIGKERGIVFGSVFAIRMIGNNRKSGKSGTGCREISVLGVEGRGDNSALGET